MNYVIAESIKTRRTILTYFIALAPVINILICLLIGGAMNIQSFGIYWWCTFMMPALAALFCSEHERQNRKSGNDKMLYTYPVNLFRFRCAGITAIAVKLFLTYMFMGLVLAAGSPFLGSMRISSAAVLGSFAVLFALDDPRMPYPGAPRQHLHPDGRSRHLQCRASAFRRRHPVLGSVPLLLRTQGDRGTGRHQGLRRLCRYRRRE